MNSIKINGNMVSGMVVNGDLCISNGRVTVNGKQIYAGEEKNITIEIVGDVKSLEVDVCNTLNITGNAGAIKTVSGDVRCGGDVAGSVSTVSGDVRCSKIAGSVSTVSGDVN